MIKSDTLAERIPVVSDAGQALVLERWEMRLQVKPNSGKAEWSEPTSWYRIGNIEFTLQPDGQWESAAGLVVRRR